VPEQSLGVAYTQVPADNLQRVKNPMIDDQVVLRPNLLHGLLSAVRENIRAGAGAVRLFEDRARFQRSQTRGVAALRTRSHRRTA
jgi:phenylalanyl-tRNA synthetase beta subunit